MHVCGRRALRACDVAAAAPRQVHCVPPTSAAPAPTRLPQGDLQRLQLEGRLPAPDVVVVDPARPGLSAAVVAYLRACGARRLVYVSCNASTQARDIKALCGAGGGADGGGGGTGPYRLVSLQGVDLYPHTAHCETVAVLDAAAA